MRKIILSDHAADQLLKRELRRQEDFDRKVAIFEKDTQAREESILHEQNRYANRIENEKKHLREALSTKAPLPLLRSIVKIGFTTIFKRPEIPPPLLIPIKQREDVQDHIRKIGRDGETSVDTRLSRLLEDDWTIIAGYCNRGGEIDRILVGPNGVFSIEVKHMKGHISCDGDVWTRDIYDKYDNLVDHGDPIKDRTGRSPAQQLNAPSRLLEQQLCRTYPLLKIVRLIVFTHERSRLAHIVDATVDEVLVLSTWEPTETLSRLNLVFRDSDVPKIVNIIKRDHEYYEKGKHSRSR